MSYARNAAPSYLWSFYTLSLFYLGTCGELPFARTRPVGSLSASACEYICAAFVRHVHSRQAIPSHVRRLHGRGRVVVTPRPFAISTSLLRAFTGLWAPIRPPRSQPIYGVSILRPVPSGNLRRIVRLHRATPPASVSASTGSLRSRSGSASRQRSPETMQSRVRPLYGLCRWMWPRAQSQSPRASAAACPCTCECATRTYGGLNFRELCD